MRPEEFFGARAWPVYLLLSLCLLPLLRGTADTQEEEVRRPELEIAESVFNWGTAFRGERIEHTFVLKNRGNAELVIEDVKPQCGCTLATDYKKSLAPNETAEVTLTLETGSLDASAEKKEKFTEIVSNSLSEDNKILMEGEIVDLLKLDPPLPRVEAILGTAAPQAPQLLRLENQLRDLDVRLESLTSRAGRLEVSYEVLPENSGFELALKPTLKPDDRDAFQKDSLDLKVLVGDRTVELRFPITIALRDRIVVEPAKSIHFSAKLTAPLLEEGAPPPQKTLDIRSLGDANHYFRVLKVESTTGVFSTDLKVIEAGKKYSLLVEVRSLPEGRKRFLRDKIRIHTDDPQVPVIEIPAMAQFPRRPKS